MEKGKIVCVFGNVTGSADWDTWHLRMMPDEIAKYPQYDEHGNVSAKIIAEWTDAEYVEKWGESFQDGDGLPPGVGKEPERVGDDDRPLPEEKVCRTCGENIDTAGGCSCVYGDPTSPYSLPPENEPC